MKNYNFNYILSGFALVTLLGCGNGEPSVVIPMGVPHDYVPDARSNAGDEDVLVNAPSATVQIFHQDGVTLNIVRWNSLFNAKHNKINDVPYNESGIANVRKEGDSILLEITPGKLLPVKTTKSDGLSEKMVYLPSASNRYLTHNTEGILATVDTPLAVIDAGSYLIPRFKGGEMNVGVNTLFINDEPSGANIVNGQLDTTLALPPGQYTAEVRGFRYGNISINSLKQTFLVDRLGRASYVNFSGVLPNKKETFQNSFITVSNYYRSLFSGKNVALRIVVNGMEIQQTGKFDDNGRFTFKKGRVHDMVVNEITEIEITSAL